LSSPVKGVVPTMAWPSCRPDRGPPAIRRGRARIAKFGMFCVAGFKASALGDASAACDSLLSSFILSGTSAADALDETLPGPNEFAAAFGVLSISEAVACAERVLEHGEAQPLRVARFAEEVARHPACVVELATKSEAQTRCPQLWYKIALHVLLAAGKEEALHAMWTRAVALRANASADSARIAWPAPDQLPTVWIRGLESRKLLNCSHWPFVRRLEKATPIILQEIIDSTDQLVKAYPYLKRRGTWQQAFLFRFQQWDAKLCELLPQTCRLLRSELPTKPGVPYAIANHEEVVIFRSEAGTFVGDHSGASNAVVNLHLTLKGAAGNSIRVGDEVFQLEEGRALCFLDSYVHNVDHPAQNTDERISLVTRVMHPDLELASYAPSRATDVEPNLVAWDTAGALRRELDSLRDAYRQLVADVGAPAARSRSCVA